MRRCARLQARAIHFVTHSMGGVLVRYYVSRHRPENLGRVVMLSPPNRGREAADHLRDSALYKWFYDFLKHYKENPRAFVWTKTAYQILDKLSPPYTGRG